MSNMAEPSSQHFASGKNNDHEFKYEWSGFQHDYRVEIYT